MTCERRRLIGGVSKLTLPGHFKLVNYKFHFVYYEREFTFENQPKSYGKASKSTRFQGIPKLWKAMRFLCVRYSHGVFKVK